jgi:hypothetical protein
LFTIFSSDYRGHNGGGEANFKQKVWDTISLYFVRGERPGGSGRELGALKTLKHVLRDQALTVAGRHWTDCSATSRSVNSTSFSKSGKCSISIPTYTNSRRERQTYQMERKQANILCQKLGMGLL